MTQKQMLARAGAELSLNIVKLEIGEERNVNPRFGESAIGTWAPVKITLILPASTKPVELAEAEYRDCYWPHSEVFDNQFHFDVSGIVGPEVAERLYGLNDFFYQIASEDPTVFPLVAAGVHKFKCLPSE